MTNKTDPTAVSIHGTNPQNLIEKIMRNRIYESKYWKEQCFGLTAETLVAKATDLNCYGGMFGGNRKPTPFICLVLSMLQIQPEKEIVYELINNTDYKYVRLLGAFYLRLVGKTTEIYEMLEPLYADYRKVRKMTDQGYKHTHVDELIEEMIKEDHACDVALPYLAKRTILEMNGALEPRTSLIDFSDDEEEEEQTKSESKEETKEETKEEEQKEERNQRSLSNERPRNRSLSNERPRDRSVSKERPRDRSVSKERPRDRSLSNERPRDRSLSNERPKNRRSLSNERPTRERSSERGDKNRREGGERRDYDRRGDRHEDRRGNRSPERYRRDRRSRSPPYRRDRRSPSPRRRDYNSRRSPDRRDYRRDYDRRDRYDNRRRSPSPRRRSSRSPDQQRRRSPEPRRSSRSPDSRKKSPEPREVKEKEESSHLGKRKPEEGKRMGTLKLKKPATQSKEESKGQSSLDEIAEMNKIRASLGLGPLK